MKRIRTAAGLALGLCLLLASAADAAKVGADGGARADADAAARALVDRTGASPFVFRPGGKTATPTIRPRPRLVLVPDAPPDGAHAGWFLETPPQVAADAIADARLAAAATAAATASLDPGRIPTASVPEPEAILLFLAGAALLLLAARRRRRSGRSRA